MLTIWNKQLQANRRTWPIIRRSWRVTLFQFQRRFITHTRYIRIKKLECCPTLCKIIVWCLPRKSPIDDLLIYLKRYARSFWVKMFKWKSWCSMIDWQRVSSNFLNAMKSDRFISQDALIRFFNFCRARQQDNVSECERRYSMSCISWQIPL